MMCLVAGGTCNRQPKCSWGNGGRGWLAWVYSYSWCFFSSPPFFLLFVMHGGSAGTNSRALCFVPKVCLNSGLKWHSGVCVSVTGPRWACCQKWDACSEDRGCSPCASRVPVQRCSHARWPGQVVGAPSTLQLHSTATPQQVMHPRMRYLDQPASFYMGMQLYWWKAELQWKRWAY